SFQSRRSGGPRSFPTSADPQNPILDALEDALLPRWGRDSGRVFDFISRVQPRPLPLAAIATGFALLAADLASASRLSHATCSFPRFVAAYLSVDASNV